MPYNKSFGIRITKAQKQSMGWDMPVYIRFPGLVYGKRIDPEGLKPVGNKPGNVITYLFKQTRATSRRKMPMIIPSPTPRPMTIKMPASKEICYHLNASGYLVRR